MLNWNPVCICGHEAYQHSAVSSGCLVDHCNCNDYHIPEELTREEKRRIKMKDEYYVEINGSVLSMAVDIGVMKKDGWSFSKPTQTGVTYSIPGSSEGFLSPVHHVEKMIGEKEGQTVKLESHWYGGWNSGGPYWIEVI